jgi:hypothetical protein
MRGARTLNYPKCRICEGPWPSELHVHYIHARVRTRTCACACEGVKGALLGGFWVYIAAPLSQSLLFQRKNVSWKCFFFYLFTATIQI